MTSLLSLPPSEQQHVTSAGGFMQVQGTLNSLFVVFMMLKSSDLTSNTSSLMSR